MQLAVRTLGRGIVVARTNLGLSQDELARRIGVSRPTLSKWERSVRWPDTREMRRLVAVLGDELWELARSEELASAGSDPEDHQSVYLTARAA